MRQPRVNTDTPPVFLLLLQRQKAAGANRQSESPRTATCSCMWDCMMGAPTGIRNAKVFPEPVLAAPRTSCPARVLGSAARWMAVRRVYLAARRPSRVYLEMGRLSKFQMIPVPAGRLPPLARLEGMHAPWEAINSSFLACLLALSPYCLQQYPQAPEFWIPSHQPHLPLPVTACYHPGTPSSSSP